MFKHQLLLACTLLAACQPAYAAQKSRTTLQSGFASGLSDNTTGAITPSILRGAMADSADSSFNLLTDTLAVIPPTGSSGQIFFNSAGAIGAKSLSGLLDGYGAARGTTLYRGASGWAALPPGSAGTVLTAAGAGADPAWQAVTGSGTGNVTGVASSVDRTLPRFNGTTGTLLKASNITVSDNDEISGFRALVVADATTARTLAASDRGTTIRFTNSAGATVTLPNTLISGFTVEILQGGAGQVVFTPATGATLNNAHGQSKTYGQYAAVRLVVIGNTDGASAIYNLAGDTGQ